MAVWDSYDSAQLKSLVTSVMKQKSTDDNKARKGLTMFLSALRESNKVNTVKPASSATKNKSKNWFSRPIMA